MLSNFMSLRRSEYHKSPFGDKLLRQSTIIGLLRGAFMPDWARNDYRYLTYKTTIVQYWSLLILAVLLSGCGQIIKPKLSTGIETLRAGEYAVDPQHTVILFKINHLGYSKFVGRFNKFEASLDFSPENMAQAKLSAQVDMSSIDVNSEKLEKRLRGNAWFNVDKYPYATFETTNAELIDSETALFKGDMTFLGITSPVDVLVKFNGGGNNVLTAKYTIGFEASAKFLRSSFGLDKFIPALGDEVELEIHAEFQRQ